MYKMLTTSLVLMTAFASLASAQIVTVTQTETITVSTDGSVYTTNSQYTYTTPSPSPTSTSASTTYSIQVGPSGQLVYSPSNITANVGDTVEFFFNPKNHTVTQSSFTEPCERLQVSTGQVGLDSGFTHATTVSQNTSGFSFVVNNTAPLWFYCRQTGHCTDGMVFAVNANANKTYAAFLENAKSSNSSSSTPSGSPTGSTGAATDTGATSSTPSSTSTSSSSSSNDAISTSVNVGLTAFLAVVGGFILTL